MTEEIWPARRAGRRGPEVRCAPRAPAAAPGVSGARAGGDRGPAGRVPGGLAAGAVPSAAPNAAPRDADLRVEVALRHGDTAVVAVAGEIDLHTADTLRARLVELHGAGTRRLVADFAAVPFCDAAGLGALVAAHNQVSATGGEIALAGVRPAQLRLLRITGLDRLFAVHPDVPDALAGHDSPSTSR
ncbi:STAS domain-containing protein [Actinomadura chibensis]|uniref:Anti-sigma factor antagonist n=1 Tax=Actinomadura chibensis TaxID=392828 RepID=A0A5D0N4W2_9ACTN|nr:STAS domain-containing protein [Actinomadura chibensis]TYB39378.1 STAS domain-containing protein [Actinomadura chibensis]